MDPNDIKEIKKRKPRWVGFFAVAILVAAMNNILNGVYLLVVLRSLFLDPITTETVVKIERNVLVATGFVIACLSFYVWRLPLAVKQWEDKEWGKKFVTGLVLLSILALPMTFLILPPGHGERVRLRGFLLAEEMVLNFLVIWYFSRSKIKSTFIK